MHVRQPYSGSHRRLVLGIDLGTTYSGISYSILDPGQVPDIKGVNRFPAQEQVGGDCKIPSIAYYDSTARARVFGAEALQEEIIEQAEKEQWTKVEWFKLHLRPRSMDSAHYSLPPLPGNTTAQKIYSDFLRYLFNCARTYIQDSQADGLVVWESLEDHVDFVLSHPNGWEGSQQKILREAVFIADLLPDTPAGHERLQFITEGEASLNFCIQKGLMTPGMQTGEGVIIVDAGGGTIDISAYHVAVKEWKFTEIAPSRCLFQGSTFVTRRAEKFLKDEFKNSKFSNDVSHMVNSFDSSTKLTFRNSNTPSFVRFGGFRDTDKQRNVQNGKLTIPGSRVESFFQPSFQAIMDAIVAMRKEASQSISSVYLVGGFAASEWLFRVLSDALRVVGINTGRPDNHTNKAVADGAVSNYLDKFVKTRVSRLTYGTSCCIPFDSNKSDHQERSSKVFVDEAGDVLVSGSFSVLLPRGTSVTEDTEFRRSFYRTGSTSLELNNLSADILGSYNLTIPQWADEPTGPLRDLCAIDCDARFIPKRRRQGRKGPYHEVSFDIIITFGPAELRAQYSWKDAVGREVRGPATVIYADYMP